MKYVLASAIVLLCACDKQEPVKPATPGKPAAAAHKEDPVCGMEGDFKLKGSVEGKEFTFCSDKCKADFDKEPAMYKWGHCVCKKSMPDCRCAHCTKNSEPCDCKK